MSPAELWSEEDMPALVHAFHAEARRDAVLAPVFDAHIDDRAPHRVGLMDLRSSIAHRPALFRRAAFALPRPAMARQARVAAERIAPGPWMGYPLSRGPDVLPQEFRLA